MENTQLALLFLCGFVLSRFLVKVRVPEYLVGRLFRRELTVSRIVLYLVALSAFLSVLIPNAVTAITLIPVVTLLRKKLLEQELGDRGTVTTALALAVIFGANIGGMASITATPANGILVAYAALRQVPHHGILRFDVWLLWGLPLTATLVLLAWGSLVLSLSDVRWSAKARALDDVSMEPHPALGVATWLTLLFLAASIVLSASMYAFEPKQWVLGLTLLFTVAFGGFLFRPANTPLLTLADCVSGLPWRGLALAAVVTLIAVVAGGLGIVEHAARSAASVLPAELENLGAFMWIAAVASFATQVLSNTLVQLALFETLVAHAGTGESLIALLLVVTLSCTCAFMTPIATGVNGLVYGELPGTSLKKMLVSGALMNVIAAVIVAACVFYVVRP